MTDAEREALIEQMARRVFELLLSASKEEAKELDQDMVASFEALSVDISTAALAVAIPIIRKDALREAANKLESHPCGGETRRMAVAALRKLSEDE